MLINKVSYITLVMLLLTATSGFSMSSHFCGEELIKVSLFEQEIHCCQDSQETPDCCYNELLHINDQQEYFCPVFTWQTTSKFVTSFEFLIKQPSFDTVHHIDAKHSNPSISKNKDKYIYILNQSILI